MTKPAMSMSPMSMIVIVIMIMGMLMIMTGMIVVFPVALPMILPVVVHRPSPCQNASRPMPRSRARRGVSGRPRTVEWSPSTRSNRWMPSPSSW